MKTTLAAAMIYSGLFAMIHLASGQTWMPTMAPVTSWWSVGSSADGNNLVAAEFFGAIYTSTNSGQNWMSNAVPAIRWNSVASSADGSMLIAAATSGGIYVSTNGGTLWTQPTSVAGISAMSVASSASGNFMFSAFSGGSDRFFVSTNAGTTWVSNTIPSALFGVIAIASSADGTKLAVVFNKIYTSTNSGVTWMSNNVPDLNWRSVASSADGRILTAVYQTGSGGGIYTSTNFGNTWMPDNAPNLYWTAVASSADGTKLVAGGFINTGYSIGPIYTSTNMGVDWISNNAPLEHWSAMADSADGNKMVALTSQTPPAGIFTAQTAATPRLNIASGNNDTLAFSWIVPSTNFVLEQNVDLTTTNWMTLTNMPTLNLTNLQDEVFLPGTNTSDFFRLVEQ